MIAKTPREAVELADEAWNQGDVESVLAFYEDDAVFLYGPEQKVLAGKAQLRELMTGAFVRKPTVKRLRDHVIEFRDLALFTWEWSISYGDTGETEAGSGSIVFRRGKDGGWRVAIESPWSSTILDLPHP